MAKKEKKDYTVGNKKWLLIIGGVALVAIIIVIILMAIPPNTYNALQMLNRTASTSFLRPDSENKAFERYRLTINANPRLNYYSEEVEDIDTLSESIGDVLDFYSDYLIYANNDSNLKANYKIIKNNLQEVEKYQHNLTDILDATKNLSQNADTYLKTAIINFRDEYVLWLKANSAALVGLHDACIGSLGKTLENNPAMQLALDSCYDTLSVIINSYEALGKADREESLQQDYVYDFSAQIDLFKKVVDSYLQDKSDIKNYYFNPALSAKYDTIYRFYTTYKQENLCEVVQSVKVSEGKFLFDKTFEGNQESYDALKAYLQGGN